MMAEKLEKGKRELGISTPTRVCGRIARRSNVNVKCQSCSSLKCCDQCKLHRMFWKILTIGIPKTMFSHKFEL
jgi:hypothetical protein